MINLAGTFFKVYLLKWKIVFKF